jgi:hypothetical protein
LIPGLRLPRLVEAGIASKPPILFSGHSPEFLMLSDKELLNETGVRHSPFILTGIA